MGLASLTRDSLEWYSQVIKEELDRFQSMSNELEQSIFSKFTSVRESYQEFKKLQEDDSVKAFTYVKEDRLVNELRDWKEFSPNIIRGSLFISVYGFVERRLMTICWGCEEEEGVKLKDLSGNNNMFASKIFFQKVLGIQVPDKYFFGVEGNLLKNIRDVYAHKVGYADDERATKMSSWLQDKALENYKDRIKLKRIEGKEHQIEHRIELDGKFVTVVIDRAQHMFMELIKEITDKLEN